MEKYFIIMVYTDPFLSITCEKEFEYLSDAREFIDKLAEQKKAPVEYIIYKKIESHKTKTGEK